MIVPGPLDLLVSWWRSVWPPRRPVTMRQRRRHWRSTAPCYCGHRPAPPSTLEEHKR